MVNLDSSLYDFGASLVQKGEMLDDLIFIVEGKCDLYGVHKMPNGEKFRQKVVRLKKGAWFGDYQILLDVKSSWEMEAYGNIKIKKHNHNIPPGKIQVFKLDKNIFLDAVNRYPDFREWLLMRANLRRCHWMKVFDENKHIFLL